MQLTHIGGVLVLLLASGCHSISRGSEPAGSDSRISLAAPLSIATRLADRPLGENEGRINLNVKAGYWSSLQSKSEKLQVVGLVLERGKKYATWAPVQSVCVQAALPGKKMVCLRMTQRLLAENRLSAEMIVGEDGPAQPETTAIDGDFLPGDEIIVKIAIEDKHILFDLNGKRVFSQASDFEADHIRYGCSSAECTFTMP